MLLSKHYLRSGKCYTWQSPSWVFLLFRFCCFLFLILFLWSAHTPQHKKIPWEIVLFSYFSVSPPLNFYLFLSVSLSLSVSFCWFLVFLSLLQSFIIFLASLLQKSNKTRNNLKGSFQIPLSFFLLLVLFFQNNPFCLLLMFVTLCCFKDNVIDAVIKTDNVEKNTKFSPTSGLQHKVL